MADVINNYKCPACTGPMHFDGNTGRIVCDYCDSSFTTEEIEAQVLKEQEKAANAPKNTWNFDSEYESWGVAEDMKSYSCPSCGAAMVCDTNTAATCCPYCGNQTVIESKFEGAQKPELIIPFKSDKNAAITALKNHYVGKKLLPDSFKDHNHIEEIQGVYVPFWLYDGSAEGYANYNARDISYKDHANYKEKITKHYVAKRTGTIDFEKVPADASKRMPDGHMDSIEPFDYKEIKDFNTIYMPGFLAETYDVDAETCASRMEERCKKTFESAIDGTVSGYSETSVIGRETHINRKKAHYAMLPVWLLSTKWEGQNFLFAMNGQTGKLVGDLPCDKGKYWKEVIKAFFISLIICIVINIFMDMDFSMMIVTCVIAPIAIGFLYGASLKGQLKSVVRQNAGAYITEEGLQLSIKEDNYIRTTTEKIDKN